MGPKDRAAPAEERWRMGAAGRQGPRLVVDGRAHPRWEGSARERARREQLPLAPPSPRVERRGERERGARGRLAPPPARPRRASSSGVKPECSSGARPPRAPPPAPPLPGPGPPLLPGHPCTPGAPLGLPGAVRPSLDFRGLPFPPAPRPAPSRGPSVAPRACPAARTWLLWGWMGVGWGAQYKGSEAARAET